MRCTHGKLLAACFLCGVITFGGVAGERQGHDRDHVDPPDYGQLLAGIDDLTVAFVAGSSSSSLVGSSSTTDLPSFLNRATQHRIAVGWLGAPASTSLIGLGPFVQRTT